MVWDAPATVAVAVLTSGACEGDGDGEEAADDVSPPQAAETTNRNAINAARTPRGAVMSILRV
jgi:hypothetical protein